MLQSLAIQELHGDERLTILLADVVNRADIGVIESRCSLRLTLKTGESLGVFGYLVGQEFERDKAMEPGVLGFVHHPHATTAQLLYDPIVRDGLADHRRRSSGAPY